MVLISQSIPNICIRVIGIYRSKTKDTVLIDALAYLQTISITTVFVDTRLWKTKFSKFPSVLRVIDISDRNPPITAR